jgi:hypothetical protein
MTRRFRAATALAAALLAGSTIVGCRKSGDQ